MPRPKRTLFIHLETTGRYLFREPVTEPNQPHLARLALISATDDDRPARTWCRLIKPEPGWRYEPGAITAHGITPEAAQRTGVALKSVMTAFVGELETVDRVVAFNSDFSRKVLERSAHECGLNWEYLFSETPVLCAMRLATDIVQIPRMEPGGGYNWPKFREAYCFFSGEDDLPPLDLSPERRGIALAECVQTIWQGIEMFNSGVSHE